MPPPVHSVKFVPADPLYADVDGNNMPDLAIGRFPVRTSSELESDDQQDPGLCCKGLWSHGCVCFRYI